MVKTQNLSDETKGKRKMAEIKVFTYNIRTEASCDGINAFVHRREFVKKRFPSYEPDLIGFQETQPHMRQWIIDNFPDYEICGVGRGADLGGESNIIAFRRNMFDLCQLDTFWLSDTPRIPGSRFSTDQSGCPRICTCAELLHRETGKVFRYYNTHLDHEGRFAQAQGISLILNRMAADYSVQPLPAILTGDFNVTPDSEVYRSVLGFRGCGAPLIDVTADVGGTYHGYCPDEIMEKIDYIFTNMPCDATRSFKAEDVENGVYLSDHYPVGAYLEL